MLSMNEVIEQVEEFRQYVLEQSQIESANLSLEELFQHWNASRLTATELEHSLESLNRGLVDAEAGRLTDADQAIADTRNRLQQKS